MCKALVAPDQPERLLVRDDSSSPRPDAFRQSARLLLRFWPLVLVLLIPLTCLAVASLSAWYVPFYLLLVGLLVLAPDRSQTAARQADATKLANRDAAELASAQTAPKLDEIADAAGTEAAALQAAAQGTVAKSRRGRIRARAKPRFVPDPTHATWVRVGPGKFIRVETPPESEPDVPTSPEEAATEIEDPADNITVEPAGIDLPLPTELPADNQGSAGRTLEPIRIDEPELPQEEKPFSLEPNLEIARPVELQAQQDVLLQPPGEAADGADGQIPSAPDGAAAEFVGSQDLSFEGIRTWLPSSLLSMAPAFGESGSLPSEDEPIDPLEDYRADGVEPEQGSDSGSHTHDSTEKETTDLDDDSDLIADTPVELAIHTEELPVQGNVEPAVEPDGHALAASPALRFDPEEAEPATFLVRGSRPGAVAASPSSGCLEARRPLRQLDHRRWIPGRITTWVRDDSLLAQARGPPGSRAFHGLCAARRPGLRGHPRSRPGTCPARFFGLDGELPGDRLVRTKKRASRSAFLRDSA